MTDRSSLVLFTKLAAYCTCFAVVFALVLVLCSSPVFPEETGQTSVLVDSITGVEKSLPVIIVDAGHGGVDGGACGADGIKEKDINLQMAKRLCAILTSAGFECRMTRSEDVMLGDGTAQSRKMQDLKCRLEFTKQFENSIFISIHQNKFPQESCRGLQVYYSKNNENSKILAQSIQSNVAEYIQRDNERQIKPATSAIYLLDNADVPAVMAECGFLSNAQEASLLVTDEYQTALCAAIFAAAAGYLNQQAGR